MAPATATSPAPIRNQTIIFNCPALDFLDASLIVFPLRPWGKQGASGALDWHGVVVALNEPLPLVALQKAHADIPYKTTCSAIATSPRSPSGASSDCSPMCYTP